MEKEMTNAMGRIRANSLSNRPDFFCMAAGFIAAISAFWVHLTG
jgi:hypothetical protein